MVSIQYGDAAAGRPERRVLHEFAASREEVRTVVNLGAWRGVGQNLIGLDGRARPIEVAEISASGCQVARVVPLLGRYRSTGRALHNVGVGPPLGAGREPGRGEPADRARRADRGELAWSPSPAFPL